MWAIKYLYESTTKTQAQAFLRQDRILSLFMRVVSFGKMKSFYIYLSVHNI